MAVLPSPGTEPEQPAPDAEASSEASNAEVAAWFRHQAQLTAYFAGGLAGIALFGAEYMGSAAFPDGHPWTRAIFVTLGLISGAVLGIAYSKLHQNGIALQRKVDRSEGFGAQPYVNPDEKSQKRTEYIYFLGLAGVTAAGGWLALVTWMDALS
jgi:hypothetical protein